MSTSPKPPAVTVSPPAPKPVEPLNVPSPTPAPASTGGGWGSLWSSASKTLESARQAAAAIQAEGQKAVSGAIGEVVQDTRRGLEIQAGGSSGGEETQAGGGGWGLGGLKGLEQLKGIDLNGLRGGLEERLKGVDLAKLRAFCFLSSKVRRYLRIKAADALNFLFVTYPNVILFACSYVLVQGQSLVDQTSALLSTIAPPIAAHELIEVHLAHPMIGYEGVEGVVYRAFGRVLERVEGGELNVIEELLDKDAAGKERSLQTVEGWEEGIKRAQVNQIVSLVV